MILWIVRENIINRKSYGDKTEINRKFDILYYDIIKLLRVSSPI